MSSIRGQLTRGRRQIKRVLVVDDNVPLREAIARLARTWDAVVVEAGTAQEAIERLLPAPDLIIADVCLPDESASKVFEASVGLWPEPLKIAISGSASPEEAFRLAQLGVRKYLAKPLTLADITQAVDQVLSQPPALDPLISACVGQVPMRELQGRVRAVMVKQALALTEGSRSGAARLLDVSRQAVQQMLRGAPRSRAGKHPGGRARQKD